MLYVNKIFDLGSEAWRESQIRDFICFLNYLKHSTIILIKNKYKYNLK